MFQRERGYGKRTVIIYDRCYARIKTLKDYIKFKFLAVECQFLCEHGLQFPGSVYEHGGSTSQQSERRYHTQQSETVVSVKMGYEYMVDAGKRNA